MGPLNIDIWRQHMITSCKTKYRDMSQYRYFGTPLGITRYPTIRYYHDILPTITIISRYSDSAIIDILQEISPTIHHDICVTEEIQNLLQKHFMQSNRKLENKINAENISLLSFIRSVYSGCIAMARRTQPLAVFCKYSRTHGSPGALYLNIII